MGRVINVDWVELSRVGEKFKEQSNEIKSITDQIQTTLDSVDDCWRGTDSNNFKTNSNQLIRDLKVEGLYLELWYEYLTKSSRRYNGNVEDGLARLKNIELLYNDIEE